ncbi:MAG TPA: hydrogenase nickel incorporation protein HypB [Steroidobacteraceae bacterium]|nr:hydrogenase nickel incorporation protein HypB [Steroidobacteraceae bacterium]
MRPGGALAYTPRGTESVSLLRNLLSENDRAAGHNRQHFDSHGVLTVNLMSSPGAGKTALLEQTVEALRGRLQMAVIEGDLATENDARRIRSKGVPAVQITTGSACHLDAHMVHEALHQMPLEGLDVVFIENVGNLVCPASFDLGQHLNVTLLSVPEGDDKPEKYPVMFRAADLLLLTKCDLLEALPEFDPVRAEGSLRTVGSDAPVVRVSSRSGVGIDVWSEWLLRELEAQRRRLAGGATRRPEIAPEGLTFHAVE